MAKKKSAGELKKEDTAKKKSAKKTGHATRSKTAKKAAKGRSASSRSMSAKKAWKTRKKLYGPSGSPRKRSKK